MCPKNFLIGCDPEFGILDGDNNIRSDDYLKYTDKMGADGGHIAAELRPSPSKSVARLVRNIQELLEKGSDNEIYKYVWKAGNFAGTHSIGGHIHLGLKEFIPPIPSSNPFVRDPNWLHYLAGDDYLYDYRYKDIVRVLDWYLACPIALIDNKEEVFKRRGSRYGFLSDARVQLWGIEYRTLGSWLVAPQIAKAVLALTKVITYEFLNHGLTPPNLSFPVYQVDFELRNHVGLRLVYKELLPRIKKCALYQRYAKSIQVIEDLISAEKNWFEFGNDMRQTWGLFKKKPIQLPIKFSSALKDVNILTAPTYQTYRYTLSGTV